MTAMLTADVTLPAETPTVAERPALDFAARYAVAGMGGAAFYLLGYATAWTEEEWVLACDDDSRDHDHDGDCYLYSEPEEVKRTDVVRAVMVGDDFAYLVDVSDLTVISEEDYCPGCGSTSCGWR